jgi:geranylgeranyl pyrophosphate synthase
MIYALESASAEERQIVELAMTDGNYDQIPFMRILQILDQYGSVARAYDRAHAFTSRARNLLATFSASPAQRALQAIIDLVTERQA